MCIVACLQINANHIVEENLRQVQEIVAQSADKFDILLLPENFAHMPRNEKERLDYAESFQSGRIQSFLSQLAQQHDCWVIAGSVALIADRINDENTTRVFQSCLVYDESGTLTKRYDKVHLFDVTLENGETYHESQYIEPGDPDQDATVKTPWGIMGLSICYDLRFPEFYRSMPDKTFLICVPAAFTYKSGEAHWQTLLRARAIENQVYIAASAQTGKHSNKRSTWGHSMIVDPWGEIKNCITKNQGLICTAIDFEYIQQLRQHFPCLEHRRKH